MNKLEVWTLGLAWFIHSCWFCRHALSPLCSCLMHICTIGQDSQNSLQWSVSADALSRAEWSQFPLPWVWRGEAWQCDPGFQCLLWTDSDSEGDGPWLTSSVSIYTLFPGHPTANGRLSSIWWEESSSERGSNPEWISQQAKPHSPQRDYCGPSGRETLAGTCLTLSCWVFRFMASPLWRKFVYKQSWLQQSKSCL